MPVKFSVIIVSFHARGFLEQTLFSVRKASRNRKVEIIVSDNSLDDEVADMVKNDFPDVKLITNPGNPGFARANNIALEQAGGELIVFLNPDTILPESFFEILEGVFKNNVNIGAAGVRMIDGAGCFLPESKRSIPGIWNSFTKLSGLADAFPRSRLFSGYYRNDVGEEERDFVEVLSGACMVVKKTVLEKTGGFDERFFMYGEDIDLSYRILQLGYRNIYLGDLTIIHFKGESSQKDEKYLSRFYGAMQLFVKKHYSPFSAAVLTLFIRLRKTVASFWRNPASEEKPIQLSCSFLGDGQSVKETQQLFHNLVKKNNDTLDIKVLCEGAQYAYEEIIQYISEHRGGNFLIHGKGSKSVAGSFNRNTLGLVFSVDK